MANDELSNEQARRLALNAQGLRGARVTKGGPGAMLRRLGAVQLDTISVLARSHELVAYARLGAVARTKVEDAYWGLKSETFEYWSHAACVLPLADWPAYEFKRRARRDKGRRWHVLVEKDKTCNEVLSRLRDEGPLTANELGGAKKGGPWWDWSETKIAAEWLLDIGELVCRERRGFARVYDLAERAIPADLLGADWSDEECAVRLVAAAGRAMGVATEADLAVYHGVPRPLVRRVLPSSGLTEVSVAGWKQAAYADPGALSAVSTRMRGRTVTLSPFDSLIWYRERLERLFDLRHRLEAYTPKEKRIYGYFAMPVLDGTRMVGLVDPGRRGDVLVAKQVTLLQPDAAPAVARALAEAAAWVGSTSCEVERVEPASASGAVVSEVTAAFGG
ncbi:MAG TPA: crosslink repair DNA glycosylase YcaQ family protein [Acidimicrobiales bacterium]|jgi:hypothetical protein|nr:crosslink repair DNA glycosylase YcaQ family protein [Acidimicrobiales bacterium]